MARLKVSAGGKVTLEKAVLEHLGVKPGDALEAELLSGGRLAVHAASGEGSLEAFYGMFKNDENIHLTIDDINEAIAAGYAGEVDI